MGNDRNARVTDWVRREFAGHESVERVVLFGSRARGDHRSKSDFDFAISAPTAGIREWDAIREVIEYAPTLLRIDLVRYEEAPEALRAEIDRDGVEVYVREPRAA